MVYTNGVGSKLLHECGIKTALVTVDERIARSQLVGNAWNMSALRLIRWAESCLPLMYHWLPLLVKNFAPFAVMVGIAETDATRAEAEAAKAMLNLMVEGLPLLIGMDVGKTSRHSKCTD